MDFLRKRVADKYLACKDGNEVSYPQELQGAVRKPGSI